MRTIGNLLWFIFGGFISGLLWLIAGAICCITIVGAPLGIECFKFASLSFFPFKKEVIFDGGAVSFLVNLIWIIFFGLWMALINAIFGLIWCFTIVGLPFGMQFFKIAKLSLMPFGASLVDIRG